MPSIGFFNNNLHRAFPFLLNTVNQPDDGEMTVRNLPNEIIVDCGFILGPHSGFVGGVHTIYLDSVSRQGNYFYFTFASDAAELYNVLLTFSRHVDDEDFLTSYIDSGREGVSDSLSDSIGACSEPRWSGYLVTGNMAKLAILLPVDGTILRDPGAAVVEPGLMQILTNAYVTSLNLANADRTRVTGADSCDSPVWPYPTGVIFVNESCLVNDIVVKAGFNCVVQQNAADNSLTFGAGVGLGAGEPCAEVPLFEGEAAPAGSTALTGGPRCNEVLRSINGQGGRLFNLNSGNGVIITSVPESNRVIINVNMTGLALCFSDVIFVSEHV